VKKLHDITLLYVEDDFDAQEKMRLLFEDEICEFYQAFNGKDALSLYYQKQPDIIITDINMPHMDGLNFAKRVKEIYEEQPIIIISGFDSRENLLDAINIGVEQFLPKPINIELLFEKIKKIITKESRKRKEKKMAYYDDLTNIYNRHFFNLALNDAIEKAKNEKSSLALFMIDLDDLKIINDTYGHRIGDMVLKQIVTNIKSVLRETDTLARIGGDEFALIVEDIGDKASTNALAKRVTKASNFIVKFNVDSSNFHVKPNTQTIHITCSIGVCVFSQKYSSKEEFMHCADVAMYKSKNSGKANYTLQYSS